MPGQMRGIFLFNSVDVQAPTELNAPRVLNKEGISDFLEKWISKKDEEKTAGGNSRKNSVKRWKIQLLTIVFE